MTEKSAEVIIASMSGRLEEIDEELMIEVVGVVQAMDQLRKALDELQEKLDARKFSEAAALGYGSIASEFIFLQRTLGALQEASDEKDGFVSEIAGQAGQSFEEVLPVVAQRMKSLQPKSRS